MLIPVRFTHTTSLTRDQKIPRVKKSQKQSKPTKKTMHDLDVYVRFSIVISIIFTILILLIFAFTQQEPSTLITCFFAMFGGEIFSCAMIKLFKLHTETKIRNGMEEGGDTDGESNDSPCEQG